MLKDHLFTVTDDGIAYLWKKETGEEIWKQRLGGKFSASPILANGHIYASSETGTTWVLKPTGAGMDVISKNQLGTGHMSTPAFSGTQVFLRVIDETSGEHRERLVCVEQ